MVQLAATCACSSGPNAQEGANATGGSTTSATNRSSTLGGTTARGGATASLGGAATSVVGGATSAGGRSISAVGATTSVGGVGSSGVGGNTFALGGTASNGGSNLLGFGGTKSAIGGSTVLGSTAFGGANSGGATQTAGGRSGGSSMGGRAASGAATGGTNASAGKGSTVGSAGQSSTVPASISKDGEGLLALSGLTIVSYGGYLNGESFQQDGIVTFNGYQYSAFWNTNRHVVMARRTLPNGSWEKFEFTDYTNSADDAHNTISIGLCAADGTLHLAFDHHTNDLHYRKSVAGFLTRPGDATWAASSFSTVTSTLVGSTAVTKVTYPRFVSEPGGNKLLFSARIGESGSGDEDLWEYDGSSHNWVFIGKYIDGINDSINAYLHGLAYTRGGSRLHAAWCWRETSDASTNHDLLYVYSDDHGRTWKTNSGSAAGTSGSSAIRLGTSGIKVVTINQNRGLINQEHMAVDANGRVHVLLSHMPDAQADNSNFDSARSKSQFFHYWRDTNGTWTRVALDLGVIANFRGKLAISSTNNVYAILPDLRIAGASAGNKFATWSLLDASDSGRFFSDPLIDTTRLELEDKLTIYYPERSSANIYALDYTLR